MNAEFRNVVAALDRFGLYVGDGVRSADDLAARVAVAAANWAVGRRKQGRETAALRRRGLWLSLAAGPPVRRNGRVRL